MKCSPYQQDRTVIKQKVITVAFVKNNKAKIEISHASTFMLVKVNFFFFFFFNPFGKYWIVPSTTKREGS